MALDRINAELQSLERKLTLLINEKKNLKSQYLQLEQEKRDLEAQLEAKNDQVQSFQNQIKISKIAGSVGADRRDASELKKKIDEYVNEIDRCIAHLSQ
jgi:predicted  nucleic acid-binding Zn-ribbon protein